jgi:hypothetical protein
MMRSITATLLSLLALAACSTDNKNANVVDASSASSGAAPVDAGLLATADAPDLDAGMPADAGDLAPDAGANPVTTAAVTTTNDGGGVKPNLPASDGKGTAFDRILVKPKVQGGDADALKSAVEKKTGHKIALMRKTAGKWFLLQFAPTSKGRTADDQSKLVDVIKSMEEIASAEGDRLVKAK